MKLEESVFDRRRFLDGLVVAGAAGLGCMGAYGAIGYLTGVEVPEPEEITLQPGAAEALARDRFVLVPYGPRPVIVFTAGDGVLRGLSAVCTHGQCNVRYRPEQNDLYCGCHHGRFTAEGVNVPGTPPPRPLRAFHVMRTEDGRIVVRANARHETDTGATS